MSNEGTLDQTTQEAGQRGSGDPKRLATEDGGFDAVNAVCAVCCELPLGNIEALLKSTDIFARGLKMMNTAVVGSACMALDDAIADTQTAMSCRSLQQLVELESDTAKAAFQRCLGQASVLCRMATQLVQDALFPLERRVVVAFDLLARNAY